VFGGKNKTTNSCHLSFLNKIQVLRPPFSNRQEYATFIPPSADDGSSAAEYSALTECVRGIDTSGRVRILIFTHIFN